MYNHPLFIGMYSVHHISAKGSGFVNVCLHFTCHLNCPNVCNSLYSDRGEGHLRYVLLLLWKSLYLGRIK